MYDRRVHIDSFQGLASKHLLLPRPTWMKVLGD